MNNRISQIIASLGIKRIDFARKIGISSPFVSELCSGAKKASERTITDICREFNVNETWLRTGEGDMFIEKPETHLDELAQEYDLDELDRKMMLGYLKLSPSDRTVIKRYMQSVLDGTVNDIQQPVPSAATPEPCKTVTDNPDIEKQVDQYRTQLMMEASTAMSEGLPPANTG